MSTPKPRRQHCIGSSEYFDRAERLALTSRLFFRRKRLLHSVPSKILVTQIPVLPKLHHRQQHNDGAKTEMPVLEHAGASVAKEEWRCRQPHSAGKFQPL